MNAITNIENESDYRAALAAIEPLLKRGFENLSPAEDAELARVSLLIDAFENQQYPMPFKPNSIVEMMQLKMAELKMKQKDLAKELGVTENRLSEVMNGKRAVNMDLAKRLRNRLQIDADFILEHA